MTANVRYVSPLLWQGTPAQVNIRQAVPVVWSQQAVMAYVRNVQSVQWMTTPTPINLRDVTGLQWSQDQTIVTMRDVTALQWTQDYTAVATRSLKAVQWAQPPTQGRLRLVAGYSLQQSSTNGRLRQVAGYTIQKRVKPQLIGGLTGLWPLIQADASITVNSSNLNVSAPVADSTLPNTNTYVSVSPKGALLNSYSGSYKLYYNRQDIAVAFGTNANTWKLSVPSATTILSLLSSINSAYGISLDPTDIVDGPVAAGATSIKLVIASTSYVYIPGTFVYLINTTPLASAISNINLPGFASARGNLVDPALSAVIGNPNLPGFANAAGVGPINGNDALLMHFDGSSIPAILTDSSNHANVVTAVGSAGTHNTDTAKFGASSFWCNVSGSYAKVPDQVWFHLGAFSPNFTIEFWIYNAASGASTLLSKGTGTPSAAMTLSSSQIVVSSDQTTGLLTGTAPAQSAWTHVAVVKNNGVWSLYIGGVLAQSVTASDTWGNNSSQLIIGNSASGANPMVAYMDELRISNVARYTAAFTPPTAPFTAD